MAKHTGKVHSKKWQAAVLATVMGASLCAVPTAQAALLALTVPSDYGTSQLGGVTGSRVTTHVDAAPTAGLMKDLNRDPGLYPGVVINGQNLMLLRQYNYSTDDLKPLMIVSPDSNPPEIVAEGIVKAAANPHGAASNGTHIFMADYDNGVVAAGTIEGNKIKDNENLTLKVETVLDDLKTAHQDGRVPFSYDPAYVTLHAEGVYMEGNHLLVAYNVNDKKQGWKQYHDGFMAQYEVRPDNTLKFRGAAPIGRNVDSVRINKYNDSYILNCIGGMQHYGGERNPESGIFIVKGNLDAGLGHRNASETLHHKATLPENVTENLENHFSDFYNARITPDGQAYILSYGLEGGKVNQYQVWKTTVSNLLAEQPEAWEKVVDMSPNTGWFGRVDYDYYTKRLWTEVGSYLFVYTDGATKPTRAWEARQFSTEENHMMFNSVSVVGGDKIAGNLSSFAQKAPQGINIYQNAKAETPAGVTKYDDTLTATKADKRYRGATSDYAKYRFDSDIRIARKTKDDLGDLKTNAFAGMLVRDGNDADIQAGGHIIDIESSTHFGSPVGIYVANGKNATITAGRLNIETVVNAARGNAITHGIWNDAAKDKSSTIDITGDVDLYMYGGYGGHGVAIEKFDRWGEKSNEASASSRIAIHGDLSIRKRDGSDWGIAANMDNVYSRFNSTGLLTTVDKSEITVDGNVDLAVYGNGITTRGQDSKVSIGGGRIVVPSGTKYGYYSVGSYLGTVNVNTGSDGKTPGDHKVQLDGDVFALNTGTVNLALTNNQSYLHGIIDNGGNTSLTLQNGALWLNNPRNTRYAEDNEDVGAGEKSRVTTLTGGSDASQAGVIFQKDSKDLTIDNYSGHTTVLYENDGLSIKGGNLIISKAEPASSVTLRTNGDGLNTSVGASDVEKELLNHTLNKLANKAFYTAYATGEKNLTGKVEVAEGLTAQSASKLLKDITWKDADGQGQYIPKPEEEQPTDGPIKTAETFSADRVAKAGIGDKVTNGKNSYVAAAYNGTGEDAITVDMKGHGLTLQADAGDEDVQTAGIMADGKTLTFVNGKEGQPIHITSTTNGSAEGVMAQNGGSVTINHDIVIDKLEGGTVARGIVAKGSNKYPKTDVTVKSVTIDGTATEKNDPKASGGVGILAIGKGAAVTVIDDVDITLKGIGVSALNGTVRIGGGRVMTDTDTAKPHQALKASVSQADSTISFNMNEDNTAAGNKKAEILGHIYTEKDSMMGNTGRVCLGLHTADSTWKGISDYKIDEDFEVGFGEVHLWLDNGATWTNVQTAESHANAGWKGSRLTNLYGGSDADHRGVIFQKDTNDITIDNYSGHTLVIYDRNPTAARDAVLGLEMIGGNIVINKAAENSEITLRTDGKGLSTAEDAAAADKNMVSATLNNLANKAFYTAYKDGERHLKGHVEIAEGLTAQSASKRLEGITWKDADGQGQYLFTPEEEAGEQTKTTFNKPITGERDQEYADAHVKHDLNYDFTKDSTIAIDISPYGGNIAGVYISRNRDVNINHVDHKLAIHTDGEKSMLVGINASGDKGKVHINGKELDVVVNNHKSGATTKAYGIYNFGKGNVIDINADTKVSTKNDNISYGIHATNDGKISLNGGNTEITVNKDAKNSAAIAVKAGGVYSPNESAVVNVNYADRAIKDAGKTVKLHGDVWATSFATGGEYNKKLNQEAQVNLGLSGTDSEWEGLVGYTVVNTEADDYDEYDSQHYTAGAVTLALQNGAQWKNAACNAANLTTKDWAGWKGSRLTNLYGGSDTEHRGVIFQKDTNDITIDNYSGHTLVIYDHKTTAARDAMPGLEMIGGNIVITKAAENSEITLRTDNKGLNMDSAKAVDKNLVSATLNNLANKAFYTAYKDGERHLKGRVEIAEGLTAQSASKRLEDITWKEADGQGQYLFTPEKDIPAEQTDTTFGIAILGSKDRDTHYVETGVLKDGRYNFTKETTFKIDGIANPESHKRELVYGDIWVIRNLSAAISGSMPQTDKEGNPVKQKEGHYNSVHMDMNNQALHMDVRYKGHGAAIAGIGKGTKVEIDNAGPIDIATKADGYSIGIFANLGGEVVIHNGGADAENKILTIRSLTSGSDDNTGNGLKSMNTGKITIDGLVDIAADGKRNADNYVSNTAIGSVASTITIGGGSIKTVNDAWVAVQAYGQFVSNDYGMVHINANDIVYGDVPPAKTGVKSPGVNVRSFTAGTNRVQIDGDLITKGGMGYRGQINIGMRGADSYWEGNYTDENPEIIIGAQEAGAVNLKIHDGAHWKGVSNGSVNAYIEGAGSYWRGYHFGGDMSLTLNNQAVWHNALIKGKTIAGNNSIKYFTSNDGVIDMTGAKAFSTARKPSRYGQYFYHHTDEASSNTGDIHIKNYSGDATVIYTHDTLKPADSEDGLTIIGGKIIVDTATEGSSLTLRTDNSGLNMTTDAKAADKNLVSATLNNLANKAFYTAYKDGERHLKGKVEIAEGLTAQSVSKRLEDITWKDADGQGQYLFTPEMERTFSRAITGGTDQVYVDAGVKQADGTYKFTKDSTITIDSEKSYPIQPIEEANIQVDAKGGTLTLESKGDDWRYGIALKQKAGEGAHVDITAGKLVIRAESAGGGKSRASGIWAGGETTLTIHGDTTIDSKAAEFAHGIIAKHSAKITLEGLTFAVDPNTKKGFALGASGEGEISVNVKNEQAGTSDVQIGGDIRTEKRDTEIQLSEDQEPIRQHLATSTINLALTTKDSYWNGISDYSVSRKPKNKGIDDGHFQLAAQGITNLWLQNGATWTNRMHRGTASEGWTGSRLTKLYGGSDADHAGVIVQKDAKDITIDNYSGHTLVIYDHKTTAARDAMPGLEMIGGNIVITKAAENSEITLRTDNKGLNMDSAKAVDKNLVSATLNNLANKAFYTAYKDGERHLKGHVEIAEGLTAQSASKRLEDITWKEADGQGQYLFTPEKDIPAEQTETTFGKAILGSADRDTAYVDAGVLKDGVYRFTKEETTIEIDGTVDKVEGKRDQVGFGPWFNGLSAAISGSAPIYDEAGNKIKYDKNTVTSNSVTMDMGGNKLNIRAKYNQGAGQTGIAAIAPMGRVDGAGVVDIQNAGAMNINVKGSGMTAALFVDGGGKIFIRNGGENAKDKVLVLRGNAKVKNNGVGIKSMNGNSAARSGDKKHSEITIEGLVDVVADGKASADGYASNEAVSAVASDINIGGGSIKAVNGAWAAIRAYGEFVSANYGIVNVNAANRQYVTETGNAHKVSDFTIGEYDTVIEGDIVTNGGMGTKGQVNIGLKDKNSHWIGNYADTKGYGVTQGMFGAVNIKMKDGAYWKGFGNGSMNITAEGSDTYWRGFSMQEKMQLTLKDGATWYNAMTADQKNQQGEAVSAQIGYLTTAGGVIDMTGANVFTASSESLSGKTTADNPSGIVESTNGVTGDVVIKNYSGNATVIYAHDAAKPADTKDGLAIKGGTITIGTATEGSVLTLRTDGEGLNTAADASAADKNLVSYTLNNLANKAFYTAYKDGERHLQGKVEIAEGLTAQSASKRLEDMTWKEETGQGQYLFTEAVPDTQVVNPMKETIDGTAASEKAYTDAGIYKAADDTYHFTPVTDPAQIVADKAVVADTKDIHLESKGNVRLDSKDTAIQADGHNVTANVKGLEINSDTQGVTAKNGNVTVNGNTVINAADGILANEQGKVELNGTAVVNTKNGTAITADQGVVKLNGKTTVEAKTAITSTNHGTVLAEEAVDLTATDAIVAHAGGKVSLDKGGQAKGNITATDEGSIITTKDLAVTGDVTARDKGGITLQAGSVKAGTVTADGTDSRVLLTDGAYDIDKVVSAGGGDVYIDSAKGETTLIKGIETKENSTAKVGLNGNKAMLKGNVTGSGNMQLALNDAAVWEGISENDNLTADLNGGTWKNTGASRLKQLGGNGTVDMTGSGEGTTAVQHYSGQLTFIYAHDQNKPTTMYGNDLKINHAADNSRIRVLTDGSGLRVGSKKAADWNLVSKTLNALAGKVYYDAYKDGENKLNGTVEIAEGLTAQSASKRLENIVWNKTNGQGQYLFTEREDQVETDSDIIYGPKETAMMRGAKSAMTGAMLSWRAEQDDLAKRLGELRLGGDMDGAWGRIYGGKQSYHAQNADVETDVKAVQIGYDKALASGWHAGVALSYLEGDNRYPAAGTGTTKLVSVTGYATKADTDGSYLDLTLKGSRVKNNYTVYNDMKHSLVGEYDTNGIMAGVEYGKRIERANGVYVTPQVAMTYGHLMKQDYDAVSSFAGGKKLHVEQDGFDSLVGRIGVEVGQQTDRTNVFAKLSVLHEFMGKTGATYSAVNEPTSRTEIDFGDTWLLVGVGGTHRLSDSTYIYGNFERSFGGDFKEDWRADLGLRWMF